MFFSYTAVFDDVDDVDARCEMFGALLSSVEHRNTVKVLGQYYTQGHVLCPAQHKVLCT